MTSPTRAEAVSLGRRLQVANRYLSIRQLSNLTGASFGTIQGLISGRTQTPRDVTVQRVMEGLENFPFVLESTRARTVAYDRPLWTSDDLAGLVPPVGSSGFRVIFHAGDMPQGYASTDWTSLRDESPLDLVHRAGVDPGSVARVVYDR